MLMGLCMRLGEVLWRLHCVWVFFLFLLCFCETTLDYILPQHSSCAAIAMIDAQSFESITSSKRQTN